jgi:hypothetical protein
MALEALVDPYPAPAALSTTTTLRPSFASSKAAAEPMTPAPMTIASAVVEDMLSRTLAVLHS